VHVENVDGVGASRAQHRRGRFRAQIWSEALPAQAPTVKFQVQTHLVDAVVIAQVFEIDQVTDPAPWTVVPS
jgi:hypothetical protein